MPDLVMTMDQRKDQWTFTATLGDVVVGELYAIPIGENVTILQRVYLWSVGLRKQFVKMFNDIKAVLRNFGIRLIVAYSSEYTPKVKKYWTVYGFKVFGECEGVHFAVMEA
jgi:hypothetical protein